MNLPYRICQTIVKMFGTAAQMAQWGVDGDQNVCEQLASLQDQIDNLPAPPVITVDRESCRSFCEYLIDFNGNVTPVGANPGPDLVVNFTAGTGANSVGNDYQISLPAKPNMGAWVSVEGDINTGSGAGINANALIPQNLTVVGGVVTFTLYTGDDGGGADDARRRDVRLFITFDKEQVTQVYVDGVPANSNSEDPAAEPDPTAPTLPPAAGKVVSDNFQDGNGNAPFNLQVRNTSSGPVNWEALIENKPYNPIPGLLLPPGVSVVENQNADGTWNYLFSGNLAAFANVIITGGTPSPAGNGGDLSLFCESV